MRNVVILGCVVAAVLASITGAAYAETSPASITFTPAGARYRGSFDWNSTGALTATIPPAIAASGPLQISAVPLDIDRDVVTTTTAYDASTTFSFSLPVQVCAPGPTMLVLRLPQSHIMRWDYLIRAPQQSAASQISPATTATLRARALALTVRRMDLLFDNDTSGTWLGNSPDADFHWIREDPYNAIAMLDRGSPVDIARANATLQAFCAQQNRTSASPSAYGLYYYNGDPGNLDVNPNYFSTGLLVRLLRRNPPGLSPTTADAIRTSVEAACEYLKWRFNIGYSLDHTNFQALGIAGLELAGQELGRQDFVKCARDEMQLFYNRVISQGAPQEYNSPVYAGVSLWGLKLLIKDGRDTQTVAQARVLHDRLLLDLAVHYDPATGQQAGPWGRVYEDGVYGGSGLSGFAVANELGLAGFDAPGRLGENYDALHSLDLNPSYIIASFDQHIGPELRFAMLAPKTGFESWQRSPFADNQAYVSAGFNIGAASRSTGGSETFVLQAHDNTTPAGIASAFIRAGGVNTECVGYSADPPDYTPFNSTPQTWEVQDNGRVLLACDHPLAAADLTCRRAMFSFVAAERFSTWTNLCVATSDTAAAVTPLAVSAGAAYTLNSGDTVFMRRGSTFLAVCAIFSIPIAGTERDRLGIISRGGGHLNIALHAADSTQTQMLPNGSRVQAGFAVEAAEASSWPDFPAFIQHVRGGEAPEMSESGTTRTLRWGSGTTELSFTYDRTSGQFLSRRIRGAAEPTELAKCDFAVQVSTGSQITLRDLQVSGVAPYSWVVYPNGSPTALIENPAATTATLTTNWDAAPVAVAPYSQRTLTRPPGSGVRQWDVY